jgi:hypothetical protein
VPEENRVTYGQYASARGRCDYNALWDDDIEELCEDDDKAYQFRVSDAVVEEAVGFIVDNCVLLSWGTKLMSLGGGETIYIPNLTRKCTATEMWHLYKQTKESGEMTPFKSLLESQGPLRQDHDEYRGSAYNIRVEWEDETTSWVPLSDLLLDDPVSCAKLGQREGSLDRKGWTRLKKYVEEQPARQKEATFRAFKSGQNMLGRTLFMLLAGALTASDEKLIRSVDYVKGTLVHDVAETLQRIISENITSRESKNTLTRQLTVVANFLKNQYKKHAICDNGWNTHGIKHGLSVPDSLPVIKHYSSMERTELDELCDERGIKLKKKTAAARIEALDEWDRQEEEESGRTESPTAFSDESATGAGSSHGTDSNESKLLLERLPTLTLSQLRTELDNRGVVGFKSKNKQPTYDALKNHLEQQVQDTPRTNSAGEDLESEGGDLPALAPRGISATEISCDEDEEDESDGVDENEEAVTDPPPRTSVVVEDVDEDEDVLDDGQDSDDGCSGANEGDCHCRGCSFLHMFMEEILPTAVGNEKNEENDERIKNALEYIKDSHEKMMLYQAHVVRVANQSAKLDEYDQRLKDLCCKEKNTEPTHLFLVIDFKMKWEPMYQREKTTQNFGKRGISWHGNRIHYYIWDEAKQEAVKRVVKLDQILDGSNKQDGSTVLGLLEAAMVFIQEEFPGANIEYLQSDNAGCYHLKDLVLGIPLLNAVSSLFEV